jgi:hypothetical protein
MYETAFQTRDHKEIYLTCGPVSSLVCFITIKQDWKRLTVMVYTSVAGVLSYFACLTASDDNLSEVWICFKANRTVRHCTYSQVLFILPY